MPVPQSQSFEVESPQSLGGYNVTDLSEIKLSDNPILVVDDDNFNILALTGLLSQFNLVPDVAHNGHSAIANVKARLAEAATRPFYQLILMDYSMPEMDGLETCAAIREMVAEFHKSRHGDQEEVDLSEKQPYICCLTAYSEDFYK